MSSCQSYSFHELKQRKTRTNCSRKDSDICAEEIILRGEGGDKGDRGDGSYRGDEVTGVTDVTDVTGVLGVSGDKGDRGDGVEGGDGGDGSGNNSCGQTESLPKVVEEVLADLTS